MVSVSPHSPALPRKWQVGNKGVKWGINCNFFGNNMDNNGIMDISDLECIDRCIDNGECTHWTYIISENKCYLMKKSNEIKVSYFFKAKCGYVPGRSEHTF